MAYGLKTGVGRQVSGVGRGEWGGGHKTQDARRKGPTVKKLALGLILGRGQTAGVAKAGHRTQDVRYEE